MLRQVHLNGSHALQTFQLHNRSGALTLRVQLSSSLRDHVTFQLDNLNLRNAAAGHSDEDANELYNYINLVCGRLYISRQGIDVDTHPGRPCCAGTADDTNGRGAVSARRKAAATTQLHQQRQW